MITCNFQIPNVSEEPFAFIFSNGEKIILAKETKQNDTLINRGILMAELWNEHQEQLDFQKKMKDNQPVEFIKMQKSEELIRENAKLEIKVEQLICCPPVQYP